MTGAKHSACVRAEGIAEQMFSQQGVQTLTNGQPFQVASLHAALALSAHESHWAGCHRQTDVCLDRKGRGKEGSALNSCSAVTPYEQAMTVNVKRRQWSYSCTLANSSNVATNRKPGYLQFNKVLFGQCDTEV